MFDKKSAISLSNPIYKRRQVFNRLMLGVSFAALIFGLFWLFWIIWTLIEKGSSAMGWSLLLESTPPPGGEGGLLNAIVGSVMMAGVGTLIGTPIGILAGTYLAEYGQRGWLAPATRFLNDVLLSAPSIIIGLFIYAVYVGPGGALFRLGRCLGTCYSGDSGGGALD